MKEKAKERKEKKQDAVVMIATVEGNTQGFTPREIRGARTAQKLYDIVGRPSYKDFKTMIRFSAIKNCPVQVQDVKNAWKIYGPSVERLRGRMVRQTPAAIVEDYDRIPIPTAITEALENLSMCGDIFFVDGVIFLMTITKKLGFTMIERLPNRKLKETILPSLRKMFRAYALRGATIRSLFTDVEFELLKQELIEEDKVQLNISSANEHVPQVERNIRYVKEGTRSEKLALPYKILPQLLIIAIVKHIVFWINTRPRKEGLSDVYSPRAILTETMPDYQVRCKLQVGTYCEVHDDPTPTNSTLTRSLPAIALEPVGNFQGGYKFMSVNTGQVLTRYEWTEVPVPEQIIRRVEARAKKERKIEKSSDELPPLLEFVHRDKVIDDSGELHNNQGAMNTGTSGNEQEPEPDHTTEKNDDDQEIISEEIEERETSEKESSEDQGAQSEERSQTRSGRYYYRNPKYQHLYPEEAYTALTIRKPSDGIGNKYCYATNILLLQMSAKRGLEVFGERAEDALVKEYKQFDEKEVFVPVMFDSLKPEERKKALNAISLIEQKRTGKVKGRTVADGSMQRHYIEKGDAASPTVTTEAVLITSAIEAHEKRVVATCDISGAFLQAEMEDYVIVVF